MKFKQYENGSCDIEFSFKERLLILKKGKIHLSDIMLRHFGNHLVKLVMDWQLKFNKDVANKTTQFDTEIKSE